VLRTLYSVQRDELASVHAGTGGLFRIWDEESLFGFSLKSREARFPPQHGFMHQRRPFLHLRPVDVRRWKLASNAIEHHVWYDTDEYGRKSLKAEFMGVDFLDVDLVTTRVKNHSREFLGLALRTHDWVLFVGMTFACAIYGGLHLIAWNAPFPSRLEKMLWRISGLGVASFGPVYVAQMISLTVNRLFKKLTRSKDHRIAWSWWRSPSTDIPDSGWVIYRILFWVLCLWVALYVGCYLPLYVFSRVYLIVECFINIFHLPESVFLTPDWSQYFPHIN
jgi:hypothetical protein